MQLGGRTLVRIAADAAHEAGIEGIAISTDGDWNDIMPALYTVWAPPRPTYLSMDETPMMDLVRYVVAWARHREAPRPPAFDAIVLLQPTSPLRHADDISAALSLLQPGVDAVVSVVATPSPEIYSIGHAGRMRRLDVHADGRTLCVPNGAIFAITTQALDAGFDWWTAPVVTAYPMPEERSIDIDTIVDLERARELWATQRR